MIEEFLAGYNFWFVVVLILIGFYAMIARENIIKKLIGLNITQTAIFLFFISLAEKSGGSAPVLREGVLSYVNPLPHTLMLTGIVVSLSTTAVGLSLAVRIYREYGTLDAEEIAEEDKHDSS
jgi:multicomponent Na+:H+ antiporter subunit C